MLPDLDTIPCPPGDLRIENEQAQLIPVGRKSGTIIKKVSHQETFHHGKGRLLEENGKHTVSMLPPHLAYPSFCRLFCPAFVMFVCMSVYSVKFPAVIGSSVFIFLPPLGPYLQVRVMCSLFLFAFVS